MILDLSVIALKESTRSCYLLQKTLAYEHLPRSLTSLYLDLVFDYSPFFVPDTDDHALVATRQLKALQENLPNLASLTYMSAASLLLPQNFHSFWTLPPSLTYAHLTDRRTFFSPEIPLPPRLRCLMGNCWLHKGALDPISQTLETVVTYNVIELACPMTALKTFNTSHCTESLDFLPAVTHVELNMMGRSWETPWNGPPLQYILTRLSVIMPEHFANLPKTLTQWQVHDQHQQIRVKHLSLLPPSLKYLKLACEMDEKPKVGILAHLPKELAMLDMANTTFWPQMDFSMLPSTMTALRTHNINEKNAHQIAQLKSLTELRLYGGRITASIARKIPRSVTYLRLQAVALRTKGRYQVKGSCQVFDYSMTNPDVAALDGTLPACLQKLEVVPVKSMNYWWNHAYDIFKGIPTSLTSLALHFSDKFQPMAIYPTALAHRSLEATVASIEAAVDENAQGEDEDADWMTDLFSRLSNLKHLYLRTSVSDENFGWFALKLPPQLTSYYGPSLCQDEIDVLPKTIRFISTSDSNNHQTSASALGAHLGSYQLYESDPHKFEKFESERPPSCFQMPYKC